MVNSLKNVTRFETSHSIRTEYPINNLKRSNLRNHVVLHLSVEILLQKVILAVYTVESGENDFKEKPIRVLVFSFLHMTGLFECITQVDIVLTEK